MQKKVLTEKQTKDRWLLLRAPWVLVPLLTGLFWYAGGGKGHALTTATGFLKRLPGAIVGPVTRLDKMGYYELARRDSIATHQRMTVQQNYARQLRLEPDDVRPEMVRVKAVGVVADTNVARIRQKLGELKRVVNMSPSTGRQHVSKQAPGVQRVEQALQVLRRTAGDEGGNMEMRELNGVVEKLLALQRLQKDTVKHVVTPPPTARGAAGARTPVEVRAIPDEDDTVGRFDSGRIEVIVPEETVLVSGGELRLEFVRDVQIGRQRVPTGTPVYGIASLSGERLRVAVNTIASEGRIFPVNLEVMDEDGMPGIYIPGAPVADALRESAGQELGSLGSGLVATNLTGEAANAGVLLARSMIGKKIRPVKVTIPAGYRVFLSVKNFGL